MSKKEEFDQLKKKLANRVKELRHEKGLRFQDFERGEFAVSSPTVQRVEYCTANPSLLQLFRISKHLEVDIKDLLDF